jgi:hypothetical protein
LVSAAGSYWGLLTVLSLRIGAHTASWQPSARSGGAGMMKLQGRAHRRKSAEKSSSPQADGCHWPAECRPGWSRPPWLLLAMLGGRVNEFPCTHGPSGGSGFIPCARLVRPGFISKIMLSSEGGLFDGVCCRSAISATPNSPGHSRRWSTMAYILLRRPPDAHRTPTYERL